MSRLDLETQVKDQVRVVEGVKSSLKKRQQEFLVDHLRRDYSEVIMEKRDQKMILANITREENKLTKLRNKLRKEKEL